MITLRNWLAALLAAVVFLLPLSPVEAARGTDSYDGNIFALYAGDGALVPPRLSLADALDGDKPILLAFYLDDSAASKDFAPLLSDLDGRWGRVTEVIAFRPSGHRRGNAERLRSRIFDVAAVVKHQA